MEAEKHVMRAQLRDLMEKQQAEVQRMAEQHQAQMAQTQQDLLGQLEEMRRAAVTAPPASQEPSASGNVPADLASIQRIAELEGWLFFIWVCHPHCSPYIRVKARRFYSPSSVNSRITHIKRTLFTTFSTESDAEFLNLIFRFSPRCLPIL